MKKSLPKKKGNTAPNCLYNLDINDKLHPQYLYILNADEAIITHNDFIEQVKKFNNIFIDWINNDGLALNLRKQST